MTALLDFKAVFDALPSAYVLLDRDLCYVAANRVYLQMASSRLEDLLGRHVFEAFPDDPTDPNSENARRLRASYEKVLATRASDVLPVISYRIPVTTEDGTTYEEHIWSATNTPILDEDGEVAFILAHTEQVTALKRGSSHEDAGSGADPNRAARTRMVTGVLDRANLIQQQNLTLDAELRHLRSYVAQAPAFIGFLRGPDHVFDMINAEYDKLVGYRPLVGKPVREALPEVVEQGFTALLDRVFATHEPFVGHGTKVLLVPHPGAPPVEKFVDFIYQPILGADGNVAGIFVLGHDVTHQKKLEDEREALLTAERGARAEAENANRAKDEFLAMMSHELRTPLNAILGWTRMLRTGSLPEDKRARALETIERNARSQVALVEDVLDVSRIIAGKLRLNVGTVQLIQVVESAVDTVRPAAEARGVRIQMLLDPDAGVTMGDADRLQQVAWNLLSNAVKFTPKGGRVHIRLQREDSYVEMVVVDSGQGISPEFLPYVFERFRQADATITRSHGGLGLGLAIVKHLVELHGGTITADSDGPGKGATFTVRIPVTALRSTSLPAPPNATTTPSSGGFDELVYPAAIEGLTIVVLDDEPDARELVRSVLEHCKADVLTASTPAEALEIIKRMHPDVIVSDIGMPGEDGYSFIRKLRALSMAEGGRTPAVALTAYARSEDRTRAMTAGFSNHIAKPVEPSELIAVIASLSGRYVG